MDFERTVYFVCTQAMSICLRIYNSSNISTFTIKLVIIFRSILGTDKYIKIICVFLAIKNRRPVLEVSFENSAERKKKQQRTKKFTQRSQEMNEFSLDWMVKICVLALHCSRCYLISTHCSWLMRILRENCSICNDIMSFFEKRQQICFILDRNRYITA